MKLMKNNKQVGGMQAFVLGIVSVAVVLAVGLIVLTELRTAADDTTKYCTSTYTYNSSEGKCYLTANASQPRVDIAHTAAYNSTGSIIDKLATVPTWIGIVIVVALAFIVLGYFYVGREK